MDLSPQPYANGNGKGGKGWKPPCGKGSGCSMLRAETQAFGTVTSPWEPVSVLLSPGARNRAADYRHICTHMALVRWVL